MTRFRYGQIWLVNFDPSFGHEYRKVRPALIIQSDAYIAESSLLTVIPLSTQIGKKSPLDLLIRKDPKNRLKSDSLLKTMQVSSFDKRRFIKRIGTATTDSLVKAEAAVRSLLFNAEAPKNRRRNPEGRTSGR
jgi:mRNA interferase MazF